MREFVWIYFTTQLPSLFTFCVCWKSKRWWLQEDSLYTLSNYPMNKRMLVLVLVTLLIQFAQVSHGEQQTHCCFTYQQKFYRIYIQFIFVCVLCTCPFIAPSKCDWIAPRLLQMQHLMPPLVLCSPLLSFKLKARTKVRGTVVACVHASISVCVCTARGRRMRTGGGVVRNRSVLQMLQGRRTEWKVLWLSVTQQPSLNWKGMPHVGPIPILWSSF